MKKNIWRVLQDFSINFHGLFGNGGVKKHFFTPPTIINMKWGWGMRDMVRKVLEYRIWILNIKVFVIPGIRRVFCVICFYREWIVIYSFQSGIIKTVVWRKWDYMCLISSLLKKKTNLCQKIMIKLVYLFFVCLIEK